MYATFCLYFILLSFDLTSGYAVNKTKSHNSNNIQTIGWSHLDFLARSTERADEDHSGVGLGSGTIHITGLLEHSFVRHVQLVSHIRRTGLLGYPFNVCLTSPTRCCTHYYYDRHSM